MITLKELKQIKDLITESSFDVEQYSWGPSLDFAYKRKEAALKIIKREIKELKEKEQCSEQTKS